MNKFLKKPLQMALATAFAIGGLSTMGTVSAAVVSADDLGDLALIPYYTVRDNYVTGMHITNTSNRTVVAKLRLRRAVDSADVLDFNIVLSPFDVWTGSLSDSAGSLRMTSTDTTCTAPNSAVHIAPTINLTGAEEGYIEVIGMAQSAPILTPAQALALTTAQTTAATDATALAAATTAADAADVTAAASAVIANIIGATAAQLLTANTDEVASIAADAAKAAAATTAAASSAAAAALAAGAIGSAESNPIAVGAKHASGTPLDCAAVESNFLAANVVDNNTSNSTLGSILAGTRGANEYVDVDNVLKVSYFIRDSATGMEFGNNAVHIEDFSNTAMMTNQELGLSSGNTAGFDFPDLNGASSNGGVRGLYDSATGIRSILGASGIINDWSFNTANGVSTDWIVTIPGQYLMVDPTPTAAKPNQRDLPLKASLTLYDREEGMVSGGALVVSPAVGPGSTEFPNEVNVVEWGGQSVFGSDAPVKVDPSFSGIASSFGWSSVALTPQTSSTRLVYDLTRPTLAGSGIVNNSAPVIGFTAWQRTFANASKNYGRIVEHSFNR